MELLIWMENLAFSTWVRESVSLWAYPLILTLHSAGLALMVGLSVVIALRLLGVASGLPLAAMDRLYPMIWVGFWVNTATGVALLLAAATIMLTNPVFYIKMGMIALAIVTIVLIRRRVLRSPAAEGGLVPAFGKLLAVASLVLWTGATTAGRLTAYIGHTLD